MTVNFPLLNADLLAFGVSVGLLLGYHGYLRARLRRNPHYTIQAISNAARSAWVEMIMSNPNKDVLAVQTLRNSTMAAIFLASTAVLLIIGVINLSHSPEAPRGLLEAMTAHDEARLLHILRLTPLLLALFSAFFYFSLAIRMYNHVGYLINSGGHPASPASPRYVARLLNRGGHYYSLGMRSYYLSVPLLFWLFGPLFLVAATLGLIALLYYLDRTPEQDELLHGPDDQHQGHLSGGRPLAV